MFTSIYLSIFSAVMHSHNSCNYVFGRYEDVSIKLVTMSSLRNGSESFSFKLQAKNTSYSLKVNSFLVVDVVRFIELSR